MKRFFSFSRIISIIEFAKTSDRWLLRALFFITVGTLVWFLLAANQVVSVPGVTAGGTFTEGILGTPRFANPVLALTRADQDISALVYSGLMKIAPDGTLVPDVAESVNVSDDGLTYTVNLRSDVVFHDQAPLTATDVLFTISLVQNADLKSPFRGNWNDVVVEVVDESSLLITLPEPYAPFIENFTLGILPAHIWQSVPIEQVPFSEYNTTPVGSGPYKVQKATFSRSGTVESYELAATENTYNAPLIEQVTFKFYESEGAIVNALAAKDIEATTHIPSELVPSIDQEAYSVVSSALPRTFALFFNQNRSTVLRDAAVREALDIVLDRQLVVDQALNGNGFPSLASTATNETALESEEVNSPVETESDRFTIARSVLENADWTQTESGGWEKEIDDSTVPLQLSIRTANNPTLEATLAAVVEAWKELGVDVQTEQYDQTDLVQAVIRPRDFSVLLFGLDVSRSQDLFPFWHSSQQNDPGLNIAQYANLTVDDYLETARTAQVSTERTEATTDALEIIQAERPALFLFQPANVYVIKRSVKTADMIGIGRPSDRFSNIAQWHTSTNELWPFFREETQD